MVKNVLDPPGRFTLSEMLKKVHDAVLRERVMVEETVKTVDMST